MSLEKSTKESFLLIEFRYGDPSNSTYLRLTDWQSNVVDPMTGETFTSLPEIEVKLPQSTGLLGEKGAEITLPFSLDFAQLISSGEPHSPVLVEIRELTQNREEESGGILFFFKGRMSRVRRRAQGKRSLVKIEAVSEKTKMKFPLGIVETHHCPWTFGSRKGCDPNGTDIAIESLEEVGTLTSITGRRVLITGLSAHADRYWHRGFVIFDGLRIGIREWVSGTEFQLVKAPPAAWLGESVTVRPGCPKTVEACRDTWDNEEHFGGFGYAMPSHNPVTETY